MTETDPPVQPTQPAAPAEPAQEPDPAQDLPWKVEKESRQDEPPAPPHDG